MNYRKYYLIRFLRFEKYRYAFCNCCIGKYKTKTIINQRLKNIGMRVETVEKSYGISIYLFFDIECIIDNKCNINDYWNNWFPGRWCMRLQPESTYKKLTQRQLDRRQPSLKTLLGSLTHSRRRESRREGDLLDSYTDWYGHWPFAAALTIILLCFADAFLTIVLIGNGAIEINTMMDWFIQKDLLMFTVVKMLMTGTGLIILVMHFNFQIYKYIAVSYLIYGLVPLYSLLIFHELRMLATIWLISHWKAPRSNLQTIDHRSWDWHATLSMMQINKDATWIDNKFG